jgi:hypothetical protein
MGVVVGYPPNIASIRAHFDIDEANTVFTYGDTIYNPNNLRLEEHLLLHEEIHSHQQAKMGVERWWNTYLKDPEFRLQEELQAFGAQYALGKKTYSAKTAKQMLWDFSLTLSGKQYGNLCSRPRAETLIRHKAKEYES